MMLVVATVLWVSIAAAFVACSRDEPRVRDAAVPIDAIPVDARPDCAWYNGAPSGNCCWNSDCRSTLLVCCHYGSHAGQDYRYCDLPDASFMGQACGGGI